MTKRDKPARKHVAPMLRRAWPLVAVSLLALTAAAPPAQAQAASTPTTLYFHIFDTFNAFPINTQPMDVAFFDVGGTSFPTASHTIVADQLGDYDFNTIYGFLTSGPVEYDFIENGRPRFHPERGIARDVVIDDGVQPTVHLYMDVRDIFSSDSHPHGVSCVVQCTPAVDDVVDPAMDQWNGLPSALPKFTFRFEMRTGNSLSPEDLQAGTQLMSGELTAHVVDTHALGANAAFMDQTAPDGTPILVPDESGIVDWAIPLDVHEASIPKADAFHVRIDWFQNPTDDDANDDTVAQGSMRLVSDAEHMPRLELAIRDPVYVEYVHPEVAAGILLIHSCVNSPWGTYDVDVANITVAVEGPTRPTDLAQVISQNAHVHGLHDKCAEVTYLWRFRDEGAANGDYAIRLDVPNLAGSAVATEEAGFTVEGKRAFGTDEDGEVVEPIGTGGSKKSPLPAAPLVGAGLLALAALARRRSP